MDSRGPRVWEHTSLHSDRHQRQHSRSEGKSENVNAVKVVERLNEMQPQFLYDPTEMQEIFNDCIEVATYDVKTRKPIFLKNDGRTRSTKKYFFKRE